jgi:competence protein ComEC
MSLSPRAKNRNRRFLILFVVILFAAVLLTIYYIEQYQKEPTNDEAVNPDNSPKLSVLFIDVGQADSTLISLNTGETMLIDAGESPDAEAILKELDERNITDIDILVATHPHSDHIGGMCLTWRHSPRSTIS